MSENKNIVLVISVLIVFIFFLIGNEYTFEDRVLKKALNKNYRGVIVEKYIDYENHAIPKVVLKDKREVIIYKKIYDKIELGDSISKLKGSFKVYLYKQKRKIVFDTANY
ncbi:hypothetical protein [Wenyingzhuangia sp. IMCC45574]